MNGASGKPWQWIRETTARFADIATVPMMVGVLMLALIALIYLGPHAERF